MESRIEGGVVEKEEEGEELLLLLLLLFFTVTHTVAHNINWQISYNRSIQNQNRYQFILVNIGIGNNELDECRDIGHQF